MLKTSKKQLNLIGQSLGQIAMNLTTKRYRNEGLAGWGGGGIFPQQIQN